MPANTLGAQTGSPLSEDRVIYRDLKAWLEQQEQNPRPLSPLQKRAIADILKPGPEPEPDLSDRDWLTLLNLYAQAHHTGPPTFTDESPVPERFISRCQFRATGEAEYMVFPSAAAGFVPDEAGLPVAPCFRRKKDAKQYAAKCCIEHLMRSGHMPTDGLNVVFPKPKPPPPNPPGSKKKAKAAPAPPPPAAAAASPSNHPTNTGTNTSSNDDVPAQGKDNNTTTNTDNEEDPQQPTTRTRVADLCRLMGLAVPAYKLTPSPGIPPADHTTGGGHQYWDGHADFGADAIKVPEEGLGRVANVYGKKNARERVAEEVLAWLVREERARQDEADALLAQMGWGVDS
ncbi:hypothetical protein N658DRAFT_415637 [Parathielavia hyrcaniae]|uniref:Uncharacterized protein n=1 Tax=Parathielavia hyrcaniae TaxID=113614 RepID=A0AAN6T657_9PEZI|nr:hypothetical protein N658DRAFT_415637 [Parathielavia hyrcaniae]